MFETVLPLVRGFEIAIVKFQLFNRVKNIRNYVLNLGVERMKYLTLTLIHCGGKLGWAIRILLKCLQHVLKMYTRHISENQASVNFKCKLTGLLLKKPLFKKHDFAALVYRLYCGYQSLSFQHLNFSAYKFDSYVQIGEEPSKISNLSHFYGGGNSLIF